MASFLSSMSPASRFIGVKAALIVFLGLVLLIPLMLIDSLVDERGHRARMAGQEIAGKWAAAQTLNGPFLVVPLLREEAEPSQLVIGPETLDIDAAIETEIRSRGIFDVVVFTGDIALTGHLELPVGVVRVDGITATPVWSAAYLVLGLDDPRGIEGTPLLETGAGSARAAEGVRRDEAIDQSALYWPLTGAAAGERMEFAIDLKLRGSERIGFEPVGKTSRISVTSDWPSPSFDGALLPDERTVRKDGFSARWDVTHYARSVPGTRVAAGPRRAMPRFETGLGVRFAQPVDFYRLTERTIKYGGLFIALTFLILFLFEVLVGRPVHPIQYLMVGAALVLFFLALLALSEIVGFALAYVASSTIVAFMVTAYAFAILKERRWAGGLLLATAMLYGLIYIVLNLEDVALIAGTVILFVALGATMFLTRNVDWYGAEKPSGSGEAPARQP